MTHPYNGLPERQFWKPSVAEKHFFDIKNLWDPKFRIQKKDKISTFGSCFAQHIGNALRNHSYNWFISEPRPKGISSEEAKPFNYDIFSCRTGNIYTSSLLRQWVSWAIDHQSLDKIQHVHWKKNNRFIDPFRPNIEPNGFQDLLELQNSRNQTVISLRKCIAESKYLVFTMGLIESWKDKQNFEYPMCPGTYAGDFLESEHFFLKQDYEYVYENLKNALIAMRTVNKNLKFILTVSPVPLIATNSGDHVLVATMESKSILRAVAAKLSNEFTDHVDYFPSYEIINSPVFKGVFFEPNLRAVNHKGVNFVMDTFFSSLIEKYGATNDGKIIKDQVLADIVCEEEILSKF